MTNFSVEQIWQIACETLQKNMSPSTFNTWILANPLTEFRLVGDDRAIGVITSPTAFYSTNVEKNFYAQIKEVLDNVTSRNTELQFKIGEPTILPTTQSPTPLSQQPQTQQPIQPIDTIPEQQTSFAPVISQNQVSAMQERLLQMAATQKAAGSTSHATSQASQSAHSHQHSSNQMDSGLFAASTVQSMTVDRARVQAQKAGLRLDFTFDTFAVSTTNEMAHAAAFAVSNQPGTAYNPLFIYGGVGVGKTHLMHAVGNNILKNNPEAKILYCTGEDFTNEIVSAIQTKKTMFFKEKFRTVDVLLIDDVQFIAGKNSVQEEFFHTFNTITKRFGQIILTSDQPPHEIALLEDRLRSRFEAGLMVDIQQPSFELRTAILLIKANSYNLTIPMNLAQIIAGKVDSARKIEGIMKVLKSEVELKQREISIDLINEIFQSENAKPKVHLRVKPYDVIKTVADFYQIKQVVIRGQQRVKAIVRARHVAMYFMKEDLQLPFMEVGRWFSNRDHTSAMHAIKKIKTEMNEDDELRQEVSDMRTKLISISK